MNDKKQHLQKLIKEYLALKNEQDALDKSDKLDKLEKAVNNNLNDRIVEVATILQVKYRMNLKELTWDDLIVKIEKIDGYHKVRWQNEIFEFNNMQAHVVELLDKNGSMHENAVRDKIGTSESHLGGVFKTGKKKKRHPAWNYMIIQDTKSYGYWKIA